MNRLPVAGAQRGFTLIELMIVVAIIGILASIALPAYEDYTVKVRVSEALRTAQPIKTAVSIFTSNRGTLPSTLEEIGYINADGNEYGGDYVSYVTTAGPGLFNIVLKQVDKLGAAAGGVVYYDVKDYTGNKAVISWQISGTVPLKYLPSNAVENR